MATAQEITLEWLMELGIRPVACAQYVNEYMPHFIMSDRKLNPGLTRNSVQESNS
jgi:hypothetical protein